MKIPHQPYRRPLLSPLFPLALALFGAAAPVAADPSISPNAILQCQAAVAEQRRQFWGSAWNCGLDPAREVTCIAAARGKAVDRLTSACGDEVATEISGGDDAEALIDRLLERTEGDAMAAFNERFGTAEVRDARSTADDSLKAGRLDVQLAQSRMKNEGRCFYRNSKRGLTGKGAGCNVLKTASKIDKAVKHYVDGLAQLEGQVSLVASLSLDLPMRIANPTCQQHLALRAYINLVYPMMIQAQHIVWISIENTFDAGDVINGVIDIAGNVGTLAGVSHMSADELLLSQANGTLSLFSEFSGLADDGFGTQFALVYTHLILECAQALSGGIGSCSEALASETFGALVDWSTSLAAIDLTRRLNEYMLAEEYLRLFYQFGGHASLVADEQGAASSAILDIINTFGYEPGVWYRPFDAGVYDAARLTSLVGASQGIVNNFLRQNLDAFCGDSDSDGVANETDNCPGAANPSQSDSDGDSFGDACDNCPSCADSSNQCRDGDGDGAFANCDCNDANPAIRPTANEICANGIDDNCNGAIDDGPACHAAQVITLASGLGNPTHIAIDASYVYIAEYNGNLGRIKKVGIGGGPVTTLVSGEYNLTGIAIDNSFIYFGSGGSDAATVKKISKTGGAVTTLASGEHAVTELATNGSDVFFTDMIGLGYRNGLVRRVSTGGGSATTLATGSTYPAAITVAGSNVYWTEFDNPGQVKKVAVTGGPTTVLASNANTVGVASDGVSVFWPEWTTANNGKINKVPVAGGSTVSLVAGLNTPWDVAIDGGSVYWVEDNSTGAVKKVSKAGGTVTVLASGLNQPVRIAVDATSVYWIERASGGTDGTLKKIALAP